MDNPTPFNNLFPGIYPERRSVNLADEPNLVGVMIKSCYFHRQDETLLCRALVIHTNTLARYSTLNMKFTGIRPIVGFDLDLDCDDSGKWPATKSSWAKHFALDPVHLSVSHLDIKRRVNAAVFPMKSISIATSYMQKVRGALTFGDFCPDKGYYIARDGNTPALCSDVMFGRMYFLDHRKAKDVLMPSDLIYDNGKSEHEAKIFDGCHMDHCYRAACLDIETVFDATYRDPALESSSFGYRFPYCTESRVADLTEYRDKQVATLKEQRKNLPVYVKNVTIPTLAPDMPGQQHEITCISVVIMNTHTVKSQTKPHRKKLLVFFNKSKADDMCYPEADSGLAKGVGIDDVTRIKFYACASEMDLLERTICLLRHHSVELLYVYNAEFDIRVMDQRVHFYAQSYAKTAGDALRKRCAALLESWHGLFLNRNLVDREAPVFQFENVRYLEMYAEMIKSVGAVLARGSLTEYRYREIATCVEKFNKDKAKLGHFKMNGCGMNVIDLYRMAGTREVKYACTSMKLNDVAPFVIAKVRELHGLKAKDPRKLRKLADISYDKMDKMIKAGGSSLFAVLVYNLVDSQLCARLAKVLKPVSALFHRCRTTLNIDVIVHGRGDNFGGFVQSIHSVQLPQLKFMLDTLRANAGPLGTESPDRVRWDPAAQCASNDGWKGGAVCDPLTGLHYSGPGMGLELSFDFASMYPSIMCALNISPETTIPWPPADFGHDLSGWVCYRWEAEGFECASLILRYDEATGTFARTTSVFASSVEYYLNQRAEFKGKLKAPDISRVDRLYYKVQEGECKVLANSFYGTAPHPCGPLISGHGRQQIAVVNACVAKFYEYKSPVVYGDTDSVMVSVGYGPEGPFESDLVTDSVGEITAEQESGLLREFARGAREVIRGKFKLAGEHVTEFLKYVHVALVEDVLDRAYVIGPGNKHQRLVRDSDGAVTAQGYPVYRAPAPGAGTLIDITEDFVKGRRIKLEYENSCSVYCHVAKKTYVALTHTVDANHDVTSISVKVRGLAAFKSFRSPCDFAVTDTFIACVMRGDCVKLEPDRVSCFSTVPWHRLETGDRVLYLDKDPQFSESGNWVELASVDTALSVHKVLTVTVSRLELGYSAVSVRLIRDAAAAHSGIVVCVRTLYKDEKYCMNHMISHKAGILRDLVATKAAELIASKMGAGFFPWSTLIKSAKNKHFAKQTLARLKVSNSSVKTTYLEIVKTWLQRITGLSVKPVECYEFHKCNPCEAALYRYPLALQATSGCITAMFGGSMMCEVKRKTPSESEETEPTCGEVIVDHPYQTGNKCYSNSRVLVAHRADRTLVNHSGKLMAHCIIDYCLPRRMYSEALGPNSLAECKTRLLSTVSLIRTRLQNANCAFTAMMNTCPEHMIPACESTELDGIMTNREVLTRLPGEKLEMCANLVAAMNIHPDRVYRNTVAVLGDTLKELLSQGAVTLTLDPNDRGDRIAVSVPHAMLTDAGLRCSNGTLYVSRSELYEKSVVDLAGLLYQSALMLQIRIPDLFPSSAHTLIPKDTLCIMPYSCADVNVMERWISAFKEQKWLKARAPKLGKRTTCQDSKEVTFHCTGCKYFYRELYATNVQVHKVLAHVYGANKKRAFGRCVREKPWLV